MNVRYRFSVAVHFDWDTTDTTLQYLLNDCTPLSHFKSDFWMIFIRKRDER